MKFIGNPMQSLALHLVIGALVAAASFAFVLTPLLSIERWALGDAGGHLVLPKLIADGLIPNIDFAYTYGPATIALNQVWALAFGNAWQSFFVLFAILQLSLAVSLAVLTCHLQLPRLSAIGCLLVLVHFMRFEYSIAHLAEKILLVNAATAVALGRYSGALALCTASALFRPASGIVAAVLVFVGLSWNARTIRPALRASFTSIAIVAATGAVHVLWFGPASFVLTVLPLSGRKLYDAPSLAPIRDLIPVFLPRDQNVFGYLGANPSHAIPFAMVGLIALCIAVALSGKSDRRANALGLIAVTLAVTFFASGGAFFSYYVPMLWLGLVAIAMLPNLQLLRWLSALSLAAVIASLVVSIAYRAPLIGSGLAEIARHDFKSLNMSESLRTDLQDIRRAALALSAIPVMGDIGQLPDFAASRPWSWCFRNRGFNLDTEIERAKQHMARHPRFVVRNDQVFIFPLLDHVERVHTGRYLTLLEYRPLLRSAQPTLR